MLFDAIVKLWKTCDSTGLYSKGTIVIVPITYGSSREKLALGTIEALARAVYLWERSDREAYIAYGMPTNCYQGSASIEHRMKLAYLKSLGVFENKLIFGEECANSITEAKAVQKLITTAALEPRTCIVVCTQLHSRSVRYIWKRLFPRCDVRIVCLQGHPDVEKGHQILTQRSKWLWLFANFARHAALKTLGMERIEKISHPHAR